MSKSSVFTNCGVLVGIALILFVAAPAQAVGISATATVSTTSTSAPYNYTVTLHNTGTTNIGAFWFGWTDIPGDYDFLKSLPTVTGEPNGWIAPVTHNGAGDGYGIEYYNISGSAIAAGGIATFSFTSPDSPTVMSGNGYIPPNKVTTSFVYIGFPQTDAGAEFNATVVPEPTGLVLAGAAGCIGLLAWGRQAKRKLRS